MPFSILGSSGELSPVRLGLRLCSLDLGCQDWGGEEGTACLDGDLTFFKFGVVLLLVLFCRGVVQFDCG